MNSNQVNQLKTVLRKYGNKNSENIVKQETGMRYNQFLEFAEPIYVISRIQSCYKDQRMIGLLSKANLEWAGIVIDNGWCTPLLPWIEKYGAELTKKAVIYLMENNLWDAYRKTDYLRMKATDHYKGFAAIDEAARRSSRIRVKSRHRILHPLRKWMYQPSRATIRPAHTTLASESPRRWTRSRRSYT